MKSLAGFCLFWPVFINAQSVHRAFVQSQGATAGKSGNIRFECVVGQSAVSADSIHLKGLSGSVGFLSVDKPRNTAPFAIAGRDSLVVEGSSIQLNGLRSYDPQGDSLEYYWKSLDGPTLEAVNGGVPTFFAPDVIARRKFRFVLSVFDGEFSSPIDTVVITVADPDWIPFNRSNSSTAYVVVSIDGANAEPGDLVGAYIEGKCRAVGEIVLYQGKAYSVFNIQTEIQELVNFQVYDLSENRICQVPEEMKTLPGSELGTFSNPIKLNAECGRQLASFKLEKNIACTGIPIRVFFTGIAPVGVQFIWNFGNARVLSGSGKGPYEIAWDEEGIKKISLVLNLNGESSNTTEQTIIIASNSRDTLLVEPSCNPADTSRQVKLLKNNAGCDSIVTIQRVYQKTVFSLSGISDYCGNNSFVEAKVLSGPGGYSFKWNTGNSEARVPGVGAGRFTVTITDSNGCSYRDSVEVKGITPIEAAFTVVKGSGCNKANGQVQVSISGGIKPYKYLWDNGEKDTLAESLSIGKHELVVEDGGGCSKVFSVLVPPVGFPSFSDVSVQDYFCGSKGSIEVRVGAGSPPYSYTWSDGKKDAKIENLEPGEYNVTVTDQEGCSNTLNGIQVANKGDKLVLEFVQKNCSISVFPKNGKGPYTYLWENGSRVESPGNKVVLDRKYTVLVTDYNGCTGKDSVIVKTGLLDATFTYTISGLQVTFRPNSTGFNVWEFGNGKTSADANPIHVYSAAGTYKVKRTTYNACGIDSSSVVIKIDPTSGIQRREEKIEEPEQIVDKKTNNNFKGYKEIAILNGIEKVYHPYRLSNDFDIRLFPNPSSGWVTISIQSGEFLNGKYYLYDVFGRQVRTGVIEGKSMLLEIDLSGLPNGIYWYGIETNTGSGRFPLILQHP